MNPRTQKMIDNKIWEYLEVLGETAKHKSHNPHHRNHAYYKLLQISRVCNQIRNEVRK